MIQACLDMDLSYDNVTQAEAYEIAKSQNPRNIPEANIINPTALALVRQKKHKVGAVLRCKFLNGSDFLQNKVIEYGKLWKKYANVKFDFNNDHAESDIRIGFNQGGSWSYIGTDNLALPQNRQTMNYGWFDNNTEEVEFRRTICHEFGHALGLIHEHQHPNNGIPWDKPAVYEYYRRTQGWDKKTVDHNIFKIYGKSYTQFSQFDPDSIMMYPISNSLTIGDFETGYNTQLSPMDCDYIGVIYPFDEPVSPFPYPLLKINETINESIGKWMEEDYYQFGIHSDSSQKISIETGGKLDTVMSLFDQNMDVIAWDDDTGQDRNAHVTKVLNKGNYVVRVRHYNIFGTGDYDLTLKSI